MIETYNYKILTGKYDVVAVPNLSTATTLTTMGNDLRLQKNRTRYDLRKFFLLIVVLYPTVGSGNKSAARLKLLVNKLTCRTVCLIMLCILNPLIYLGND